MKTIVRLFALCLLCPMLACEKSDETPQLNNDDYLIFGHYYGLCMGESCIETFKLTDEQLFEDTNDAYGDTDFDFVALSDELFQEVRDLRDALPSELLEQADQTFGCPDCADQGGILIQLPVDGEVKTWYMDQDKDGVPTYLHPLMDSVNEKITRIND